MQIGGDEFSGLIRGFLVKSDGTVMMDSQPSDPNGKTADLIMNDGEPFVIPIDNREKTLAPPTEHLGNPISSRSPKVLGKHAYSFYEEKLEEAKRLFGT